MKIKSNMNEIKEKKMRQMARVISMATSLHYAIEDLMGMMIADDDNEDFSLEDPEDEELYLALGLKAEEIDGVNTHSKVGRSLIQKWATR